MSSLRILLSTFFSASKTLGRVMSVAFVSTLTFAWGHSWSRRTIVSSIMPLKCGCMVGSPLPANVSTSGSIPSLAIDCSFSFRASFTSSRVGNGVFVLRCELNPHSQYRQSNVHTLPSSGKRFIPKDIPNRLLLTGPNIGDGNIIVAIFLYLR